MQSFLTVEQCPWFDRRMSGNTVSFYLDTGTKHNEQTKNWGMIQLCSFSFYLSYLAIKRFLERNKRREALISVDVLNSGMIEQIILKTLTKKDPLLLCFHFFFKVQQLVLW